LGYLKDFGYQLSKKCFKKLSLHAKDKHLLYFKLSTSIDDAESIKGVTTEEIDARHIP